MMGYLFDSGARAVRPILGIPGASLIGEPLELGAAVESASPSQEWSLAVIADTREVKLVQLRNGAVTMRPIEGVSPAPGRIVFSPSGSAAVLYQRDARALEVITGLPGATATRRIDISAWDGEPTSLAVADDGGLVLAGLPGLGILSISGDDFRVIPYDVPVSAIAFAPRGSFALAAAGTSVFLLRDGELQELAGGDLPPVDVALSADTARAFVAYKDGTIRVIDIANGAARQISCRCTPTAMRPLAGSSVFRLNEISDNGPVLLLDGSEAEPRVWFVPLDRGGN